MNSGMTFKSQLHRKVTDKVCTMYMYYVSHGAGKSYTFIETKWFLDGNCFFRPMMFVDIRQVRERVRNEEREIKRKKEREREREKEREIDREIEINR